MWSRPRRRRPERVPPLGICDALRGRERQARPDAARLKQWPLARACAEEGEGGQSGRRLAREEEGGDGVRARIISINASASTTTLRHSREWLSGRRAGIYANKTVIPWFYGVSLSPLVPPRSVPIGFRAILPAAADLRRNVRPRVCKCVRNLFFS